MGRGVFTMAATLSLMACSHASMPAGEYEVDVIDDGAALLVKRPELAARHVSPDALPPGAREGDVIVDGRVDRAMSAQLREDVRTARARLRRVEVSEGGSIELGDEVAAAPSSVSLESR